MKNIEMYNDLRFNEFSKIKHINETLWLELTNTLLNTYNIEFDFMFLDELR